jgi:acetyl esterase
VKPPEELLDPDLAALVADPRMALRPPSDGLSVVQIREAANAFLAKGVRPGAIRVKDIEITGAERIAGRLFLPPNASLDAVIVFFHGGAFVFGDLETHDALCRRLAIASGVTVAAVDYRLAPEHPYPAALEDTAAAVAWVRSTLKPRRVGLAGDSAGAQLAIATALDCAAEGSPVQALGLLYPCLDPSRTSASQERFGEGHMLTGAFLDWAWSAYRGEGDRSGDPFFDLTRADLSSFPPTAVLTAGHDPLRDEGLSFVERARAVGVEVSAKHFGDMIHGFAGLPGGSRRGDEALAWLSDALRRSLTVDGSGPSDRPEVG